MTWDLANLQFGGPQPCRGTQARRATVMGPGWPCQNRNRTRTRLQSSSLESDSAPARLLAGFDLDSQRGPQAGIFSGMANAVLAVWVVSWALLYWPLFTVVHAPSTRSGPAPQQPSASPQSHSSVPVGRGQDSASGGLSVGSLPTSYDELRTSIILGRIML